MSTVIDVLQHVVTSLMDAICTYYSIHIYIADSRVFIRKHRQHNDISHVRLLSSSIVGHFIRVVSSVCHQYQYAITQHSPQSHHHAATPFHRATTTNWTSMPLLKGTTTTSTLTTSTLCCLKDETVALGGDMRCGEVNVKCAYRVMVLQQRDLGRADIVHHACMRISTINSSGEAVVAMVS
jgi:hypothetical protein